MPRQGYVLTDLRPYFGVLAKSSRDTRITRKDKEGFQATVNSTLSRAWIVKFVEGPRERGLRIRWAPHVLRLERRALVRPLLQLFSPASVEDTSIMVSIGSAGGSKQGSEDCGIRKQAGVQGAGRAIVAVDPTWSMPSARVLMSRPNHRTKPKNPHTHRFPFKSGGSCGGLETALNSV